MDMFFIQKIILKLWLKKPANHLFGWIRKNNVVKVYRASLLHWKTTFS